MDTYG
jgi:hypothetical protein